MASNAEQQFLDRATALVKDNPRYQALALHKEADHENEFTEDELIFFCSPLAFAECATEFPALARELGPLLHCYAQEKTEAERELTCLYEDPLRRADLRLLPLDGAAALYQPKIIWERDAALSKALRMRRDPAPCLDLQWMEDRFWVWVQSAASSLQAGSVFEALHQISCLRTRILGPLLLKSRSQSILAFRELEQLAGADINALRATVPRPDARSCEFALREAAKLYVGLRENLAPAQLVRHQRAEMAVMRHLHAVSDGLEKEGLTALRD